MGRAQRQVDGEQLRRCAQSVYDKDLEKKRKRRGRDWTPSRVERGAMLSRAYAICTSSLQDKGYLKPGTSDQTRKGRLASGMKALGSGAEQRAGRFDRVLAGARKVDLDELMRQQSGEPRGVDLDELMARHSRRGAANAGALDLPGTTVAVVRTGLQPLREAMDEVFACETAYGTCKPQAPSAGHCILAAMVVQDLYGGELIEGSFGNVPHYWNRISSFDIDLTGDQFGCARVRVKRGRLNGGGSVFRRVAGQQLNQPFNGKVCGKHDAFVLALLPVLGRHGLNDYVSRIARCQVGAS